MANIGGMYGAAESGTFMGLPPASIAEAAKAAVAVLGAATATPYPSVGAYCAGGPRAIREGIANRAGTLGHMDFDLGGTLLPEGVTAVDCGDLPIDAENATANRAAIKDAIGMLLDGGAVPVLLGGDDSVPIPLFTPSRGAANSRSCRSTRISTGATRCRG